MKRLFALVLMPGMICGLETQAQEITYPSLFVFDSAVADNCPQPAQVQMQCVTPVVAAPRLRTVRRAVPRTTYQTVTKTIMVPATSMETRQTQSVEQRDEVRERAVTVYDQVAQTRQITTESTVLVPQIRNRVENYAVQVPVVRSVQQNVVAHSLQTETRTGTRRIERLIPATEVQTVVTGGQVVRRSVESDHGGVKVQSSVVGGCAKQVAVPVMRKQIVEQTIEYDVQVARPVATTRTIQQTELQQEIRTRTVPETVMVPTVQSRTHEVTEMKTVPRQATERYTVRVPHVVTREIQVPVMTMVARTVTEQVPVTTYDVIEETVCE